MRKTVRKFLKGFAIFLVLSWSLIPIMLIALSSLKADRDIFAAPPRLFFEPTLSNYTGLWTRWSDFFDGLLNSVIITTGATLLAVLTSAMAGYAYSRFRHPALAGSAFFLIFIRLIPPIVITLPLFPVANALRLNDTHILLIVLYATFFVSLGTLVMRTFIDQIPRELDEAAHMDGATRLQILRKVILPLSAQGMVAVAVFVVVYAWNEFLFAFIFTTTNAKTAPLVISEMFGAVEGVEWGVLFAASTLQLLPVLLFVILAQKHLVAGLTAGATKG
ncbi:carbohydrate ABC transporter permease [Nitratireductor pacificus]|uniref:Binding-protein-dependent transport systems inner membrane component n=1 Tax=Nitratireductor pacificus pht-3B TaxID=391937 RepID=K2N228_9HYPH|nr:carbohydrate ABC transporter permease [Nitratireductor pacificus]EKF18293.1 binding-protein-dependent transport systems inner membrane component [Nitratireductor pacificus pht-3B]